MAKRTTLSLDDDVATLLNQETRRSGISFKEAVNHYLRLGLTAARQPSRKKFVVKPLAMGLPPGLELRPCRRAARGAGRSLAPVILAAFSAPPTETLRGEIRWPESTDCDLHANENNWPADGNR